MKCMDSIMIPNNLLSRWSYQNNQLFSCFTCATEWLCSASLYISASLFYKVILQRSSHTFFFNKKNTLVYISVPGTYFKFLYKNQSQKKAVILQYRLCTIRCYIPDKKGAHFHIICLSCFFILYKWMTQNKKKLSYRLTQNAVIQEIQKE